MSESKYPKALQEKIDEYCVSFDKMIVNGKAMAEKELERLKSIKAKLPKNYNCYENYSVRKIYDSYAIKNVQDLMDNKEEIALANAYAHIKSNYYTDELNAFGKVKTDVLFKDGTTAYGIAFGLGIAGLFVAWWLGLGLFIVGGSVGFSIVMKKNKPAYERLCALEKQKKDARAFVLETEKELSETAISRIEKITLQNLISYAETQKTRAEIARLKSDIDRLGREVAMPVTTAAKAQSNTSADSLGATNGRREIVDDYGRVQGYAQDGKIYNEKSDVVGYVDENNRVYDSDYKRVGEVRSDGKIENYR